MNLSIKNTFFSLASATLIFAILVIAKSILIPLGFALLLSFILFPVAKKLESWKIYRIVAALLAILLFILVVIGMIFFFSRQLTHLVTEFDQFQKKILLLFADVTLFFNKNIGFAPELGKTELFDRLEAFFKSSIGGLVKQTFTNTATFLAGLLVTIIFTFLFLIYRNGLSIAIVHFFPEENRDKILAMLKSVQKVGQKYLFGMIILIVILGLANSIGLMIIGVENPFLFGFLAGILAIVPYVGTVVGAIIPILYAFLTYESAWIAFWVAVLFWCVQFVESNFLSPKIVGRSLQINAITSILSLIIGASVWGIAGMILFLPFAAMFKIICLEFRQLKPIALLIGDYSVHEQGRLTLYFIKKIKSVTAIFKKIN